MVPTTVVADFHLIDPELTELRLHLTQLLKALQSTRVLTELIAEGIAKFDHLSRLTDRARSIGLLAVEFRRSPKIRVGITGIHRTTQTLEESSESGTATEGVIDSSAL